MHGATILGLAIREIACVARRRSSLPYRWSMRTGDSRRLPGIGLWHTSNARLPVNDSSYHVPGQNRFFRVQTWGVRKMPRCRRRSVFASRPFRMDQRSHDLRRRGGTAWWVQSEPQGKASL